MRYTHEKFEVCWWGDKAKGKKQQKRIAGFGRKHFCFSTDLLNSKSLAKTNFVDSIVVMY